MANDLRLSARVNYILYNITDGKITKIFCLTKKKEEMYVFTKKRYFNELTATVFLRGPLLHPLVV